MFDCFFCYANAYNFFWCCVMRIIIFIKFWFQLKVQV